MGFCIGLDMEWENLSAFWLDHVDGAWTSVSFLLDADGRIVDIHPGGEYHRTIDVEHQSCQKDFDRLEAHIKALL